MTDRYEAGSGPGPPRRRHSTLALLADSAFSHLVIGSLTVLFWRGLWEYLNRNLTPGDPELGAWICFAAGNAGLVVLSLSQNLWRKYVTSPDVRSPRWLIGYHAYTYALGSLNVLHWRGLWTLMDIYTGINEFSCWISLAIGQGVTWLLRCSKCSVAPPLWVEIDNSPDFFVHSGRFHPEFRLSVGCVLDSIFTVFVVHQLTILYWRGTWELFDVYLFPDDPHASAVYTFLCSFVLHAFVCLLQPLLNSLYRWSAAKSRHAQAWQWLLETVVYFVGNPVCVTHWRGVWNLFTAYSVDSEYEDAIDIATHFIGIGALMLMMCGHSVTTRGCALDGDSPAEEGCMFSNRYLRYWFEGRWYTGDDDRKQHPPSPPTHQNEAQQTREKKTPVEKQSQRCQSACADQQRLSQRCQSACADQQRQQSQPLRLRQFNSSNNLKIDSSSENTAPIVLQITYV